MLKDQRSFLEAWDYGGGKIIFFILLLCFWSPYLTHLNPCSHATSHHGPSHSDAQVLVFKKGSGVKEGWGLLMCKEQQTDWMQPWAAGLERALKRLQGHWMWELPMSPGLDANSDQIKDGSQVIRSLRSQLLITGAQKVSHVQQACNRRDNHDTWCLSSAGVSDLSSWKLSKWLCPSACI